MHDENFHCLVDQYLNDCYVAEGNDLKVYRLFYVMCN